MPIAGGISDKDEAATPDIQELVVQVKAQVAGKTNATYETFEAICYRTQVVAGRNYFVKIHVGGDDYIHARIYKNLQQEVSVHSVQEGKSKDDALEYF